MRFAILLVALLLLMMGGAEGKYSPALEVAGNVSMNTYGSTNYITGLPNPINLTDAAPWKSVNAANTSMRNATNYHVINIVDYGAVGDDSTNNNVAIQAAVNAAVAARIPLFIPHGIFKITAPILYNDTPMIFGYSDRIDQSNCTQIHYTGTGNVFTVHKTSGSMYKAIIKNLAIIGEGSGTAFNILTTSGQFSEFLFDNVRMIGFATGIQSDDLDIGQIENCYFYQLTDCIICPVMSDVTVRDCNIWQCTNGLTITGGYNLIIEANHFEQVTNCIIISNSGANADISPLIIQKNTFLTTANRIIQLESVNTHNVDIENFYFRENTCYGTTSRYLLSFNITAVLSHGYVLGSISNCQYYDPTVSFIYANSVGFEMDITRCGTFYPGDAAVFSGTGIIWGAPSLEVAETFIYGHSIGYGTAAPTTGTWARGDIRFRSDATSGATPGWVCTTAGTPGTWRAMAVLASS